eukprot:CAMPEP_0114013560 /NCGR_PEP_ID=MMETSP0372-20130328/10610_1 /TAXON_ID=340204 /ORGANISM="Lankesteria abbotti" /LENGTH=31 /assembly_acc=CAM_ASM_000359
MTLMRTLRTPICLAMSSLSNVTVAAATVSLF